MGCNDTAAPLPVGRTRLAMLIDAENASPCHAGRLFEAVGRLGDATVWRIYSFGGSKTPRAFRAVCHWFEIEGIGARTRLGRWT